MRSDSRPVLVATCLALLLPLDVGCKGINFSNEESYGLRLVTIGISAEEYVLLNGQLLSKRPAQAEIRVAGEFKVQCHASYAGRSSLDSFRKSYNVDFCGKKYNKRSGYRLTAQAIDKTMTRSLLGYDLFDAMGIHVPLTEPASLYINRKYQGLYIFMETVDKEFFKAHDIGVDEVFKARYGNAGFRQEFASRPQEAFSYEGKGQDSFAFIDQIYKALWLEPADDAFVRRLSAFMDIDSFLSYMAVALYIDHWDGFDNNYFLAYHSDTKKLITVPWDLDRVWEKTGDYAPSVLIERNALLVRLLKIPSFKSAYVGKLQRLGNDYPPEAIIEMMRGREEHAREAYKEDPILARYQSTAFDDLEKNIWAWNLRVKDWLANNAI